MLMSIGVMGAVYYAFSAPAEGHYSIITTADQEVGIDWAVTRENARRAALLPPQNPISKQEYVKTIMIDRVIESYIKQSLSTKIEKIAEKYLVAPDPVKIQVEQILGVQ